MSDSLNLDIIRVPDSACLNCGKPMNMLGTGDPNIEAKPEPGDVTVCIKCGAVMKLDQNLRPRGMSDQEMDELVADREWMDEVAKMVHAVQFVRKIN
jgi:hypothetical protein